MEMADEQGKLIEAARNVLEKMLSLMDIQATVVTSDELNTESDGEPTASAVLDVKGEDLGILIGRRGQTLACLQYLLRLMVSQQTQTKSPIIVDVEGYKRHRWEALRALALRMAEQVKMRRMPFTLEPMPPFERRIIHLALANHPDVITESIGQGETRKVVIRPKKK